MLLQTKYATTVSGFQFIVCKNVEHKISQEMEKIIKLVHNKLRAMCSKNDFYIPGRNFRWDYCKNYKWKNMISFGNVTINKIC